MNYHRFILALVFALCFFLPRTSPAEPAADGVTIEFYLAESVPAAGLKEAEIEGTKDQHIYMHKSPVLTREDIAEARQGWDVSGRPAIMVKFGKAGSEKMAKASSENIGKRLAIVINGKVICAPTLRSKFSEWAQIDGTFTDAEVKKFVQSIRAPSPKSP